MDKVSSSSEKFRVTTKTLNKKKDTLGLGFPIDLFPKRASAWEDYDDKEMKDARKRGRQKKPNNFFNERERERERANGSLSAFSHASSLLHSFFLLSYHQRRESKERGKLSVTFYISLLYKSR